MSENIKGLTIAGQAMKARLEAYGVPFKITRIVAGSAASDDPLALTEVPSPKQEFVITKREQRDASAILHTRLTNESLKNKEDGYSMWIIGIYAESPEAPETLYRVIQFASPRPVPPYSDGAFSYSPAFYITAANSEQVTVVINPDWTDEASAAAQARADEAYELAQEALNRANAGGGVVFSPTRPEGDWKIWLIDFGEITDFPFEDELGGETPLILDTAPLSAPGDFAVIEDTGDGETITNMTDNPSTAKETDIILAD